MDGDVRTPDHATAPHSPGNNRCVGGLTAALGQNAAGDGHSVNVLGAGLFTHEDHRLALLGHPHGLVRREHDLAGGRTRASREPLGDRRLRGLRIDRGMQQLS